MNKISLFTKLLVIIVLLLNISCSTKEIKETYVERSVD